MRAAAKPLLALLLVLLAAQGGPAASQSTSEELANLTAADIAALQPYLKQLAASLPLAAAEVQPQPNLLVEKTAFLCSRVKRCGEPCANELALNPD